jgi:ribonuclease P protein component
MTLDGQHFPPEVRIRRGSDYRILTRTARRFHTRSFVFLYRRGEAGFNRVGVTVSRRVGNAVVRNRVKRWVREFARRHMGSLAGAWDIVVIARPRASDTDHDSAVGEMGELFDFLSARKT